MRTRVLLNVSAPALVLASALSLQGCGGSTQDDGPPAPMTQAALGELIFKDVSLSASGRQSCATCHVESAGHAQDNALAAQLGGTDLARQGSRTTPSTRYLAFGKPFALDSGGTPSGGFFWDGRASSLADQAGRPFLNTAEMALASKSQLAERLSATAYSQQFAQVFGADIFSRPDDAFVATTLALQAFGLEDPRLRSFTSKYDAFLKGAVTLSEQEARGLVVFNAIDKGNCSSCHPSSIGRDGEHPLFTNFTYHALGIPRNMELAANADPAHFDLGLCARENGDLLARQDLCGAFKTPSLRNVALRQSLFHNGRFKRLSDAVSFYAQRDTNPERFYSRRTDASVDIYDDLPATLKANVTRGEAPYNVPAGAAPVLSEADIADIVAFLGALTDGWVKDDDVDAAGVDVGRSSAGRSVLSPGS